MSKKLKWYLLPPAAIAAVVFCVVILQGGKPEEKSRSSRSSLAVEGNRTKEERQSASDERKAGLPVGGKAADVDGVLTPEQAKALLEKYSSEVAIRKRALLYASVIKKLCLSGYPEEAWELIESGAGEVRNLQVSAFFFNAGISQEQVIDHIEKLEYAGDAKKALLSYFRKIDIYDIQKFVDSDSIMSRLARCDKSIPADLSNLISLNLESKLNLDDVPLSARRDISRIASELYAGGKLGSEEFGRILASDPNIDSFEKWEMIGGLDRKQVDTGALRAGVISGMVLADPEKALGELSRTQQTGDLKSGMERFINSDSKGAYSWYENHSKSLTAPQKDSVILAFADVARRDGDASVAKQWINQITDENLKAGELAKFETK